MRASDTYYFNAKRSVTAFNPGAGNKRRLAAVCRGMAMRTPERVHLADLDR
ncbi:MAG: hypothetical protein M3N49_01760 [Candidatus Eremiobacteraeota bacterium]|nr:hypothetical protein [Candidatus Eremiobacteraeota bacterium]